MLTKSKPVSDTDTNFDSLGRFILRDFDRARPFSSFLPGIAGALGIPMWVFYVNRGQAMASFGVESKDHPVMEYQPANRAYQLTSTLGFRTFLSGRDTSQPWQYEPFSPAQPADVLREMFIGMNEVEIRETNPGLGLETSVLYFLLPGEPFASLVRRVKFRNIGKSALRFEALDGMPALIPYGVNNLTLKEMSRTIEAWMGVENVEQNLPFYRLRATPGDSTEVHAIRGGNFAFAFSERKTLLPALVDPALVFGADTSLQAADGFNEHGLADLARLPQVREARTPCAFFGVAVELAPEAEQSVCSLYGFANDLASIQEHAQRMLGNEYIEAKLLEARNLAETLTEPIATSSASPVFDAYCRQTFLDNVMRGGWPLILGGRHVYHIYSRKHGDLERDYNFYFLAAEHYSQGNGNYRDVNQNRRSDVFFEPRVGDFSIRQFVSLIQADGYNPLVVQGTTFTLPQEKRAEFLSQVDRPGPLETLFAKPFTPGQFLRAIQDNDLQTRVPAHELLQQILAACEQHTQAEYHEGYWIDHWTYNLDLIEAYLAVYPDKKDLLLFDSEPLPFFDSPAVVAPRSRKYVLANGKARQFNAIVKDPKKAALIAARAELPNWSRDKHGTGSLFRLPLFSKLALLAIIKFASLDPSGMGIEMEAGKPGWYDALNGLPGLFGASMPETFELLRLVNFLAEALEASRRETSLPAEADVLLHEVLGQLARSQSDFAYWDAVSTARELYFENTNLGFDGTTVSLSSEKMLGAFARMKAKLLAGISRAAGMNDGVPPTYFAYEATEYEPAQGVDAQGYAFIRVKAFRPEALPLFLEGPVRQFKTLEDTRQSALLYKKVKEGPLFDQTLKMYKLNASLLDQPHDIGRARAFSRGWLENESIWLHMSYKYLLEVLKAGLYSEFFDDLRSSLVAFMDPLVYGRSPLENSSFIVSSAHPDPSMHGAGFVARLSGSTAEFLSIWQVMMAGRQPFIVEDGELQLALQPALPGWLFAEDGSLSFRFLGKCQITYHNPARKDTIGHDFAAKQIVLHLPNNTTKTVSGNIVPPPYAEMVRSGQITEIEIHL